MEEKIYKIILNFKKEIKNINNLKNLYDLKNKYLGKKSELSFFLKKIKFIDNNDEKVFFGKLINNFKKEIIFLFEEKKEILEKFFFNNSFLSEKIDITLPGYKFRSGSLHPLNLIINKLLFFFKELGYFVFLSSDIEKNKYNFDLLNLSPEHPARDNNDTFYFMNNKNLLRTHCTNSTVRLLKNVINNDNLNETIAMVTYGNTYRRDDDDATHSHQFTQFDGCFISPDANLSNLKWTLTYLCKFVFNDEVDLRIRPSFFPFTEPSFEIDILCICKKNKSNKICSICKNNGWIEIIGAGIINKSIFKLCNLTKKFNGFAFGIGVERIAMIKYNINDIRKFYTNNINFLSNFINN